MHSGYRRYDRYFMASREMYKTHYSTTTKEHFVFSNNSLVFRWKWNSPAYRTLLFSALTHQIFHTVYRKCRNRNKDEGISPRKMFLISQSLRLEQVCLFCEPDTRLKAPYLECWFAPFPGNLNLKGFLYFPYLQNKSQNDKSAFHRIIVIYQSWNIDVWVPRWSSQSLQVWGPAGWSARRTNREKSQWCWNISRALGNPEHTDQKMVPTHQASNDRTTRCTQSGNKPTSSRSLFFMRVVAYLLCWTFPPCFSSASKSWCHSWMPGNQKGAKKKSKILNMICILLSVY